MLLLPAFWDCCDDQVSCGMGRDLVPLLAHSRYLADITNMVMVIVTIFKFAAQESKSLDVLIAPGNLVGMQGFIRMVLFPHPCLY